MEQAPALFQPSGGEDLETRTNSFLPYSEHPVFDLLADDWLHVLSLELPGFDALPHLVTLGAFHVMLYQLRVSGSLVGKATCISSVRSSPRRRRSCGSYPRSTTRRTTSSRRKRSRHTSPASPRRSGGNRPGRSQAHSPPARRSLRTRSGGPRTPKTTRDALIRMPFRRTAACGHRPPPAACRQRPPELRPGRRPGLETWHEPAPLRSDRFAPQNAGSGERLAPNGIQGVPRSPFHALRFRLRRARGRAGARQEEFRQEGVSGQLAPAGATARQSGNAPATLRRLRLRAESARTGAVMTVAELIGRIVTLLLKKESADDRGAADRRHGPVHHRLPEPEHTAAIARADPCRSGPGGPGRAETPRALSAGTALPAESSQRFRRRTFETPLARKPVSS